MDCHLEGLKPGHARNSDVLRKMSSEESRQIAETQSSIYSEYTAVICELYCMFYFCLIYMVFNISLNHQL